MVPRNGESAVTVFVPLPTGNLVLNLIQGALRGDEAIRQSVKKRETRRT